VVALAIASMFAFPAYSLDFSNDLLSGSLDNTVSSGFGRRTRSPSSSLIVQGNTGTPAGTAGTFSNLGDQGDLNYAKGDFFTTYVKGTHQLTLKLPEQFNFMASGIWLRDFTATHTTGYLDGSPFTPTSLSGGLTDSAATDLRYKGRVMDLWLSKVFDVADQQVRVRAGKQVFNWGESLFTPGGINASNPIDIMRLSQPGTQIKEAILPTPAVSVASGLGGGFNIEGYVQTTWEHSYLPPTGSYWSVANGLGKGQEDYGFGEQKAKGHGQWGLSLRYKVPATSLDLGLYALNYHDKLPQFAFGGSTGIEWVYPENRHLFGVSANLPVGDWAVGTELSYRPKDAVALNSNSGCASQGGQCWVDTDHYQWHLTGLYSLNSGTTPGILNFVNAQGGFFLFEFAVISFPHLQQTYGANDDPIASGGWGWGNETGSGSPSVATGNKTSAGISMDFSLTYDGTVIPGWQVTPEIFYGRGLHGRTPTTGATFMQGAQIANILVTFARNPTTWQFGVNYAKFWGGNSPFDQPYADRDYFGAYASYSF